MLEFIQANWNLLLFAGFFVLMLRMHAGGAGCGMGHGQQQHSSEPEQRSTAAGSTVSQNRPPNAQAPAERHAAGCH